MSRPIESRVSFTVYGATYEVLITAAVSVLDGFGGQWDWDMDARPRFTTTTGGGVCSIPEWEAHITAKEPTSQRRRRDV